MNITPASISDVLIIQPNIYQDSRGFFIEMFQTRKFDEAGLPYRFVQDNLSGSKQGTLRGLHYQIKNPQSKLLTVQIGEIFDVAVDIRKSSPTFGQWVGISVSAQDHRMIWIPAGFAHGFFVLTEWAEVMYKVTDFYNPEWERTLRWDDPDLGIKWPIEDGKHPILSPKDANGTFLRDAEVFD